MTIEIKPIISLRDLKTFVYLPEKIHRGHSNWVPPIYWDDRRFFNRRKNRAFEESAALLVLAYKEGMAVGRIMGIINHRYNSLRNERNARFGFMECIDDQEFSHALLQHVEDWARKLGME